MAKNDKKNAVKPVENTKKDAVAAPEKVSELPINELPKTEKKTEDAPKKAKLSEPTAKKSGGWGKFILFLFVLSLGGAGFLAVQLKQTEQQSAEALQKLQTAYDDKVLAITNRVNLLETEVKGLKDRPIVEHVAGVSENLLNQKLAALREELEYRLANMPAEEVANDETGKSSTGAQEVEIQPRVLFAPETVAAAACDQKTQEVLLASGAIIVRDLAEQSVNFAYEAEVLQILARGNELAEEYTRTIRSFANGSISGKNQLIHGFHKVFAELNNAAVKNEPKPEVLGKDAKWTDKIIFWLKKAFIAQRTGKKPVFVENDDEVLALVNEGHITEALNALKTSEKYAKMDSLPLNEWKIQAERYTEFNQAISGLIMNALANIRLKELEHAVK